MHQQAPRGLEHSGVSDAEGGFESALRRDLAGAPLVAYESRVGGWQKRAFDILVTTFCMPVWLPALVTSVALIKLAGRRQVLHWEDRLGYGGRNFRLCRLSGGAQASNVELLPSAAADLTVIARLAEDGRAKWRQVIERLPQLFNVLQGTMSLVGPSPLGREAVDALKAAKRYYLSARPGVIGLGAAYGAEGETPSLYRAYKETWSLFNDILIMWDAWNGLRNRGRLWKPDRVQARGKVRL